MAGEAAGGGGMAAVLLSAQEGEVGTSEGGSVQESGGEAGEAGSVGAGVESGAVAEKPLPATRPSFADVLQVRAALPSASVSGCRLLSAPGMAAETAYLLPS